MKEKIKDLYKKIENKTNILINSIKLYIIQIINKIIKKLYKKLEEFYVQFNKLGVQSESNIFMYNRKNNIYIKTIDGIEFTTTEYPEEAKDWSDERTRDLTLFLFNVNKQDDEKYIFRKFVKMFGWNINQNISQSFTSTIEE